MLRWPKRPIAHPRQTLSERTVTGSGALPPRMAAPWRYCCRTGTRDEGGKHACCARLLHVAAQRVGRGPVVVPHGAHAQPSKVCLMYRYLIYLIYLQVIYFPLRFPIDPGSFAGRCCLPPEEKGGSRSTERSLKPPLGPPKNLSPGLINTSTPATTRKTQTASQKACHEHA